MNEEHCDVIPAMYLCDPLRNVYISHQILSESKQQSSN